MPEFIRLAERALLIMLAVLVIWRILPVFSLHPHVLLLLASEISAVVFLVFQRKGTWATSFYTTFIAFAGTSAPLLIAPSGQMLASDFITAPLIWTGTALALAAKLSLRRSFGLVPANRGVKSSGAYRFVRHPMYTGYVLNHIGFLLMFFSAWNLAIYLTTWVLLYLRAIEEERFLLQDPLYADYAKSVKCRIVPGLI
jgi:protein-S-isoprenylcysteine O-methyltransferase Ste14